MKKYKAFTITELLTIISIMAILAIAVWVLVGGTGNAQARDAKRVSEVDTLRTALKLYHMDNGKYPEQEGTWCSIETDCTTLVQELLDGGYLTDTPEDPLFGRELEEADQLFSYQYISTSSGDGYLLHVDLETREPYEVHAGPGSKLTYIYGVDGGGEPGSGGGGSGGTLVITQPDAIFTFDSSIGQYPDAVQIDLNHYLVAYQGGFSYDGYAKVLEINDFNWAISEPGDTFIFHSLDMTMSPDIAQIDGTHYLVVYSENTSDRTLANILEVDTGTWNISTSSAYFQLDTGGIVPDIAQIDGTHYLVTYWYENATFDKIPRSIVLEVDTGTWDISTSSAYFDFDTEGSNPKLTQIDSTHYLAVYESWGCTSIVLEVDTGTWDISTSSALFRFYTLGTCLDPITAQIGSSNRYLATYHKSTEGWSEVLKVDTGTWDISTEAGSEFEFDSVQARHAVLSPINSDQFLTAYYGPPPWPSNGHGVSNVLEVDTGTWSISTSSDPFEFDPVQGHSPVIVQINSDHYLIVYTGSGSDGKSVVLEVGY